MKINIGIVDDHQLFLKSVSLLIESFQQFEIVLEALGGEIALTRLQLATIIPDIILLDVNMPVMDGTRTATAISKQYPGIKLVALSMKDDDLSVIGMLKAGCCAYLLKDIHPNELERALQQVYREGYYNADLSNLKSRQLAQAMRDESPILTKRELDFLRLACSDRTYMQIAAEMYLAERTIDGYRESLFRKLNVQSRVGMVLEGLRRNLVQL